MEAPQWIIMGLGLITVGLMLVRYMLGNQERGYDIGLSMTIGDRELQEDHYTVQRGEHALLAVLADGVGNQYGGKVASKIAVETFKRIFDGQKSHENPNYFFQKAFYAANRNILNTLDEGRGSACVSAVLIQGDQMYYATVGNVRIAIWRERDLVPVTAGHTIDILARERYHQGRLTKKEAINLLAEHRLYNYVGQDSFQEIEYFDQPIQLHNRDIIVLMSDGVYETVSWKELEGYLGEQKKSQEKAFQIIEHINTSERQEKDNGSIVIIERKM